MVSIANAIPFNVIAENDQWSNIFDVLEHLKEKTISGMTFDEAFWRTLIASTDHPLGKHAASTEDLQSDFREWVISLLYSVHDGRIANFDEAIMALMISSASRLDDTKFDIMAFGKEGRGERPNPLAYVLESTQLMFDTMNKMEADSKPDSQEQSKNASKQLEDSIIRLWEANREGAFPSPAHIRETLGALNHFKVDHPGRSEIYDRIYRFKAALGTKLDSRRIFITREDRLGLGPHSLEEEDEIWVLAGANVPFVLRKLGNGNFALIGEAFVFGVVHGEAVKDVSVDEFCEIRLE